MESCPCGSGQAFGDCCEPLIQGKKYAQTAEDLLRSRYTAHVITDVDYIYDTTHPAQRRNVDRDRVAAWSRKSEWLGLEIIQTQAGQPSDDSGTVEFIARYREKGKTMEHREIAEFKKHESRWFFFDGQPPKPTQFIREGKKIGRNDPCPCGSGRKYKKCCGG
jgi:SEC-C motif-containing protein